MPQRATKHISVEQAIVDTTPAGSIRRSAAFAGIPFEHNIDRLSPPRVPIEGLFGTTVGTMVEDPPIGRVRYSLEDLAAIRASRRERDRLRDQEKEERYDMYGEDHRSRDNLLRVRMNRIHPPMYPHIFGGPFWREEPELSERRANEAEIQEDNQIGRLRAEARQRNEAFNEEAVRNVRRRTTSEGVVLAHARQANLFG